MVGSQAEFLAQDADVLFAVTGQLDGRIIIEMERFLSASEKSRAQLVICVYPATSTNEANLTRLLILQEQSKGRFEVYVLPIAEIETSPFTTTVSLNGQSYRLWFENANALEHSAVTFGHFGMHIDTDETTFRTWLQRFVVLQEAAVPLTTITARVPPLIPARGSNEAADSWRAYVNSCREISGAAVPSPKPINVAHELSEQRTTAAVERVCRNAGIEPPDELAIGLSSIFSKGDIVTIDKSSRTPPLELPVRAEWLGVEGLRSVGLLSRETKYRLRIFDDKTHRDLNSRRNGATTLLKRLSFPIAENLHWMPHAAKPLFEAEWKRLEEESQALIRGLIGKDTTRFAQQRKHAIERDANQFYQEFHPNQIIDSATLAKIVIGLEDRLHAAVTGNYLPKVSFAVLTFVPRRESPHVAHWAYARTLLVAASKYMREALVDPYFFRGYRLPPEQVITAMNVADDWLTPQSSNLPARAVAEEQLASIAKIDADEGIADRDKCKELLRIIRIPPPQSRAAPTESSSLISR